MAAEPWLFSSAPSAVRLNSLSLPKMGMHAARTTGMLENLQEAIRRRPEKAMSDRRRDRSSAKAGEIAANEVDAIWQHQPDTLASKT